MLSSWSRRIKWTVITVNLVHKFPWMKAFIHLYLEKQPKILISGSCSDGNQEQSLQNLVAGKLLKKKKKKVETSFKIFK